MANLFQTGSNQREHFENRFDKSEVKNKNINMEEIMKFTKMSASWTVVVFLLLLMLLAVEGNSQDCATLPGFPTSSITSTQDRDRMLCQLGMIIPVLPPRLED